MTVFGRWWKAPDTPNANPADYDIYPVHLMDGAKVNHKVMGWTMRFNDVLDADILHNSIMTLLDIGDWRKLAGRLKRNAKGQLEIHVPKQFTKNAPAFQYKHETKFCDESINYHPIGRVFITPTEEPSIQKLPESLRHFMAPDGYPETVEGLIESNKSQIGVTIVSFKDATLVSLALPHTLGDIVTLVQMIHNWSRVLAGRAKDVPPILDAHTDALEAIANDTSTASDLSPLMNKQRLGKYALAKWLVRQLWERSQRNRDLRMVYIPKDAYQRLLSKVREEQEQLVNSGSEKPEPKTRATRIDEVDIITAWLTRIIASQEVGPRPVTILSLYNIRFQLRSLLQAKGMFAQIMVSITCATFPDGTAAKDSVSQIAHSYRQQVAEQSTQDQVVAYLRQVRNELKGGSPSLAMYGEADSLLIFCNPLAKLNLIKMANFAPAVKDTPSADAAAGERRNPPGTIVSNVFNPLNWKDAGLDALFPLGADHTGGNWIMAKMSPESWETLAEELKKL